MDILDHIEWAANTIRNRLKFGLPELQAAYSREKRAKGALLASKKEIIKLRDALLFVKCHPLLNDQDWLHETINEALNNEELK